MPKSKKGDAIRFTETWVKRDGKIYKFINGRLVEVWAEKDAPVVLMRPLLQR